MSSGAAATHLRATPSRYKADKQSGNAHASRGIFAANGHLHAWLRAAIPRGPAGSNRAQPRLTMQCVRASRAPKAAVSDASPL